MSLRVAVVGGGLSGSLASIHLLEAFHGKVHIDLIERRSRQLNRGVAYSAHLSQQLLNVPAGRMGLFPHEPDGFLKWAKQGPAPRASAAAFLPRRMFGDFVEDRFHETTDRYPGSVHIVWSEAVSHEHHPRHGHLLHLTNGMRIEADVVLLAMGSAPPAHVPGWPTDLHKDPRYIPWPWAHGALRGIGPEDPVLFVGAGLTMADVLLSLRDQGHTGQVVVLSRRGELPREHVSPELYGIQQPWPDPANAGTLGLWKWLRMEAALARGHGAKWQDVMDAVKPRVQEWWAHLPRTERERFLRHVRPFWEVHRHRMPAEVHARLNDLRNNGAMRVMAGRIQRVSAEAPGFMVEVEARNEGRQVVHTSAIINCTGPQSDTRRMEQPLLRSMLIDGYAAWDELHLGLRCGKLGALVGADGRTSSSLFALGPLTKGAFWESTAVPEIRQQTFALAARLAEGWKQRAPRWERLVHLFRMPSA